ncbi:MAG: GTPase ObgE [Clostridia bacterium]
MFLDKVKIKIKAGNGGGGSMSFFRSKLTMYGGPDGGDGGKGGDIIFVAKNNLNTLYNFSFKKNFVAPSGENGSKKNMKGADGKPVIIDVPVGTVILDAESKKVVCDLNEEEQTFVALKGGMGGSGNARFASSTHRTPMFAKTGEEVETKEVILELKTVADVGLVGMPNVGKSTLLSVISNAKPKIDSYAFTTLVPNLGVSEYAGNSFVVADIPGLVEGASEGVGLGTDFLKHIERVRLIIHIVDVSESEDRKIEQDYKIINKELAKFSKQLAKLPQILVLSKCDLINSETLKQRKANIKAVTKGKIVEISSATQMGIDNLKKAIWSTLEKIPKKSAIPTEITDFDKRDKSSIKVERLQSGAFEVSGGFINNLSRGIVLSEHASFAYFQAKLEKYGVMKRLKEIGLKNGDIIKIKDAEFEYFE